MQAEKVIFRVGGCQFWPINFIPLICCLFCLTTFNQNSSNFGAFCWTKPTNSKCLSIRLVLFVDHSLNWHLEQNLGLNRAQMRALMRTYVQQIESIFSSLRSDQIEAIQFELVDVRVEKLAGEFTAGQLNGDIDFALSKFCLYQAKERARRCIQEELSTGSSCIGWDLALLLTSNDLFSSEESSIHSPAISRSTMGISPIGGLEWADLSCLMVEFGVGNGRQKQDQESLEEASQLVYPTRGFGSIWVAAHEIAHNLGIHHDGFPFNSKCELKTGNWIMSPHSYAHSIATSWSPCSIESLSGLHLDKFFRGCSGRRKSPVAELPGQVFGPDEQCRFFDTNSIALEEKDDLQQMICNVTLKCSSLASEPVSIGPALEGTKCGPANSICLQNSCSKSPLPKVS